MRSTSGCAPTRSRTPPGAPMSATIERAIKPAIGNGQRSTKLSARTLETLYRELRRCRTSVRRPDHSSRSTRLTEEHDCTEKEVYRTHLQADGRFHGPTNPLDHQWRAYGRCSLGLDRSNPARVAQRPEGQGTRPLDLALGRTRRPRLLAAAFEMDDDWGTLVWLVMTTGLRRGRGLRPAVGAMSTWTARSSRSGEATCSTRVSASEKDTKTHQMRRIALDSETGSLSREYRQNAYRPPGWELDQTMTYGMYVFTGTSDTRSTRNRTRRTRYQAGTATWPNASRSTPISTPYGTTRQRSCSPQVLTFVRSRAGLATVAVARQRSVSMRHGWPRPTAKPPKFSAPACPSGRSHQAESCCRGEAR